MWGFCGFFYLFVCLCRQAPNISDDKEKYRQMSHVLGFTSTNIWLIFGRSTTEADKIPM